MQRPPELFLQNAQQQWEAEQASAAGAAAAAAAAYASQAHHLFALFCAPANEVRQYTLDEKDTAVLRAAATELQAYVHPKVQVASFKQEGRGIVAADELKRGEVLLRVPAAALINPYTALTHPTFSPLAQLLLGLPPEILLQQEAAAQQRPQEQQQIPEQPTELQPLVDCDVVLCLFLLFLAFTGGEEGGRALLRFLPAAGEADAAATAEAVCGSSAGGSAAAAAAEAARKEELLLMDSEGVVEFLGDAAMESAVSRSLAKCKMMHQELLPLLQQSFPPPAGMQHGGGVLSACRAAAAAAAATTATDAPFHVGLPTGAVAAAAAAKASPSLGALSLSSCSGAAQLSAFLAQLNSTDFLWAHLILESRSFSLPLRPLPPLQEFQPGARPLKKPLGDANKEGPGAPVDGPPAGDPAEDREGEDAQEDADEEEEEEHRVPFLLELLETAGAAQESRCVLLPVGVQKAAPSASTPTYFVRLPPSCASFVPLGDLLNHHFHGQVLSPVLEEECGSLCLCLRLACDVPKGAQVYAHYGPLQSWQFLAYFGFCPSSFPRLQPPRRETATDKTDSNAEWQFNGEDKGNPVDFLTLQVEVPEDDGEYELKKSLMDLQDLPLCGLFSTGVQSLSWRFLASLFVSSHASLDHFLCAGGAGAGGAAAAASAAAAAAGEKPWGPTFTFTAIRNDPEAADRIREIISDALQSVAKAAEDRTAQLDKWRDDTKAAPRWTRVWGEKLRIYLDNQKALANTQMARLADYLTFIPSSSSVL
ncbi:phospholipase/carboxylesterase, putative [Eimeria acervulina]|uniref:Phospholipase/carboxylesterase, putative n=1 Tax=Eimeria acervulina TaxID=5801 RepID=U6GNA2_EIMAC|nr:phospholipase/carboxylesterase, putative [Eimeria acervulina]CDI80768.1 phospholipase/carboxylesterase, putative [Eimeria acervulina]